jgi:hypothetical protein
MSNGSAVASTQFWQFERCDRVHAVVVPPWVVPGYWHTTHPECGGAVVLKMPALPPERIPPGWYSL